MALQCTSRRGCADRNSFRLYMEKDGDTLQGKYIWTEFRCPNVASNSRTCNECTVKLPKHKYQANPKCDHGFVGGPYPSDSKLYGSPFYLTQIKGGWKIVEADERRAKEAQLTSSNTMPKVKSEEVPAVPTVEKATKAPKQPRKAKVIKNATDVVLAVNTVEPTLPTVLGPAKFIEAMTPPIKIYDVIIVKVKKIHCKGTDYYFDSISGKIYAVATYGVGAYKGRYDPETDTLNLIYHDSDLE